MRATCALCRPPSSGPTLQAARCRDAESIISERFAHEPTSEVLLAASVGSWIISCQPPLPGNLDLWHRSGFRKKQQQKKPQNNNSVDAKLNSKLKKEKKVIFAAVIR